MDPALDAVLTALESLGQDPPGRGGRRNKPTTPNLPNMTAEQAWAEIRRLVTHSSPPPAAAPTASPTPNPDNVVVDTGSTSDFSSNQSPEEFPDGIPVQVPPRDPRCKGHTYSGDRCRAWALNGKDLCFAHDPDSREEFLAASSAAGVASGESRRRQPFDLDHLFLHNRLGVQVAIDAIFRLELTGQLPAHRTRTLVRLLAMASRNLPDTGPIDPEAYDEATWELNADLAAAIEATRKAEERRQIAKVEAQMMERQQLARDIEGFPQLDRRPASSRKLDDLVLSLQASRKRPDWGWREPATDAFHGLKGAE
jgi:hypothetical protein